MIFSFTLKAPPQILFGPGRFNELRTIAANFGSQPLFIMGGRSFVESPHFDKLEKIAKKSPEKLPLVHVAQEPSPQLINSVVAEYQETEIDLVIGIGGGSVLDAAKAISAMLPEKAKILDYLEGVGSKQPSGKKLPFIAIPTTSGTGSEATSNAVITEIGENGFKKSLRHDNYIPNVAIVDPELTLSCPPPLTAACAMDCFTQLVEGYLSSRSSRVTDMLALEGIQAINRSLHLVCHDTIPLEVRSEMSYAALLSGIVLANAGLGTVHGFASVLGGLFNIPHGVVCGSLMAPTNEATLKELRKDGKQNQIALQKYTRLGRLFSSADHRSDTWYQDHFINELYLLSDTLKIPMLNEYGITEPHIPEIAGKTANKYNPIALSENQRAEILYSRIS